MLLELAIGADGVLAGDLLEWIDDKSTAVKDTVNNVLILAAAWFALASWVVTRSWKKAMIAGLGGVIVVGLVTQLGGLSNLVESELPEAEGMARASAQVVTADGARGIVV